MDELQSQLTTCNANIADLMRTRNKLNSEITEQRLFDWMADNGIQSTELQMNEELFSFVRSEGIPGDYIDGILEFWKVGTNVKMYGMLDGGSVTLGPPNRLYGLFPPDMVIRAINELRNK
jgi:hypothetical protein